MFLPDFQKHSAAASAATIDKYEITSAGMPSRTHKFAAPSAVRRNICAIGRRDLAWSSTLLRLAKVQVDCATNLALVRTRNPFASLENSPFEISLDQATMLT